METAIGRGVLDWLKCLECKQLVHLPVRGCNKGHLYCEGCYLVLTQNYQPGCVYCGEHVDELESWSTFLKDGKFYVPCRYASQGCLECMLPVNSDAHAVECGKRPVLCGMPGCSIEKISYPLFAQHILANHAKDTYGDGFMVQLYTAMSDTDAQVCMQTNGPNSVFLMRGMRDNDMVFWACDFSKLDGISNLTYNLEVHIGSSGLCSNRKAIFTGMPVMNGRIHNVEFVSDDGVACAVDLGLLKGGVGIKGRRMDDTQFVVTLKICED